MDQLLVEGPTENTGSNYMNTTVQETLKFELVIYAS